MSIVEKCAKTVEEAIELALYELQTEIDMVDIEVIEEGKSGIFGFIGNKQAKVRVALKGDENLHKANSFVSIPAGFAALRQFDPEQTDGAVERMRAAANSVVSGDVAQAVRDARSALGHIAAGDWIVRVPQVVCVTGDLTEAVVALLDHLVGETTPKHIELITGDGADPGTTASARRHIASRWSGAELVVSDGGQPHFAYLAGVDVA